MSECNHRSIFFLEEIIERKDDRIQELLKELKLRGPTCPICCCKERESVYKTTGCLTDQTQEQGDER